MTYGSTMKKINLFLLGLLLLPQVCFADTFGNVFAGTETDNYQGYTNRIMCSPFQAPANGTITQINALLDASTGTQNAKAVVYAADGAGGIPGTILGVSNVTGVTTTKGDFAFTGLSVAITSGTVYWFNIVSGGDYIMTFYEALGGSYIWQSADTAGYYTSPPNNPTQASLYSDNVYCVYATYTPSGGGGGGVTIEPMVNVF